MATTSGHPSFSEQFPRWAGVSALAGGLSLALAAFFHSLQPPGCVDLRCDGPLRQMTPLVSALGMAAGLLILIGVGGLVALARRLGQHMRLANAAMLIVAGGLAALALSGFIQAVFFNGNFPAMPFIAVPGVVAVATGFVLIGIFIFRSRMLPRWLGLLLLVSSIALLAANEQSAAVILAIPFGLTFAWTGYVMLSGGYSRRGTASSRLA